MQLLAGGRSRSIWVQPTAVADAGGWLVLAGLLEGLVHDVDEVLVLDATSLLVAEYLALHHAGAPARALADYGLALRVIGEWFPARALALDAALAASDDDIDSTVALALAESLGVALITKHPEMASQKIPVLLC